MTRYKYDGYVEYVGIAYDEQKRARDKQYPLIEWQMTEKDCLKYCYDRGFDWDGLYEHFTRLSCFCCPLQKINHLRNLYFYYPELWQEMKRMDKLANNKFRPDYSIDELEEKFEKERKRADEYIQHI